MTNDEYHRRVATEAQRRLQELRGEEYNGPDACAEYWYPPLPPEVADERQRIRLIESGAMDEIGAPDAVRNHLRKDP